MASSNRDDKVHSRKLLVPLATLAVAAAVAVGSGATWTSETTSNVSVTGGDLVHTNDQNGATLDLDDLEPGDVRTGELTITNTGTMDAYLAITEDESTNTFGGTLGDDLLLTITAEGMTNPIFKGTFGAWADGKSKDVLAGTAGKAVLDPPVTDPAKAGDSITFTFEVELVKAAANASQNATAAASYTFETTPVGGDSAGIPGIWDAVVGSTDSSDGSD